MGPLSTTNGVFLADKSAWERRDHPSVGAAWRDALDEDRILICSVVRFELLFSTRDLPEYDALAERLAAFRDLPVTTAVQRTALAAHRELAAAGPLHHRVPLPDLLIAAAASGAGVPVVHCDRHFDRIATVLPFESRWLVRPDDLRR